MKTVADAVSVDLPEGTWRAVDLPEGVAFVTSADYDACGGDIYWATFTVSIAVLEKPRVASADPVDAVMGRRVQQGRPEASAAVVAGEPAARFEYYDGVRLIHSYFVRRPSGATVEITLATFLHPTGAQKVELETAARDVFSHLRWV